MQLLRLGLSFSAVGGVIKGAPVGTRLSGSVCPLHVGARGCWNAFVWTRGPGYVCSLTNSPPPPSRKKGHFAHNSWLVVLAEWWKHCLNSPLALVSHEQKLFWMGKRCKAKP